MKILSLRKLHGLRIYAMVYFLYSGSSCKDTNTLPCIIFLCFVAKTSYIYISKILEKQRHTHHGSPEQFYSYKIYVILVPRTYFNVTALLAYTCIYFFCEVSYFLFFLFISSFFRNTRKCD